ncbi:hypothetical protein [Actinopolymorpha rutila]|uniref:Uncharacterized protein n=1 Tax=Actinopolymorpha rutila TaxID=446787 RepID=A0A852ZLP5_9ACTN|nr:hypothetical protein [Actinopolymorpha rutila]NYH93163.1 hypothetical protein [Actinopolymorpha rutila]
MIRRGALAACAAGVALFASGVLAACGVTSAPSGATARPSTPAVSTPSTAPASSLDCRPTVAPTPSPPADVARIVAVRDEDCDLTPGGAPARFGVEVTNPTGHAVRAGLSFTFSWGLKADELRLEYHDSAGWHRTAMKWINPEEPELLYNAPVPVRLRPHETRTYRLRVGVPKAYQPEYGLVTFSAIAGLDLGDKGHRTDSSAPGPVFALNPPMGSPVNLTLPRRQVTLGGAPVEFTATVDNATGRSFRRAGLDFGIDFAAADHLRLDVRRGGGWHRLTLRRGVDEHSVLASPTADFAVPAGYHHRYRFRLTLRPGAVQTDPLLSFSLRDRTRPGSNALPSEGAELGTAYRKLHMALPTVWTRGPRGVKPGTTARLAVGFANGTSVSLPPVHLRLTVTNPASADWFTMSFRPSGSAGPWTTLPVRAVPHEFHIWTVDLPAPRPGGVPAGFRADYDVRLNLSRWDFDAGNLVAVQGEILLADGTLVAGLPSENDLILGIE